MFNVFFDPGVIERNKVVVGVNGKSGFNVVYIVSFIATWFESMQ